MTRSQGDYPVGYKKPPKSSRFKSGASGNPRGRPKGAANLKTDLADELAEPIRIREGDRERSVSKQRAMIKALVAKALKGDPRAAGLLMALIGKHFEKELASEANERLSQSDTDILEAFIARRTARTQKEN
jgi:hypothetical protein